jgi:hypothetical protein
MTYIVLTNNTLALTKFYEQKGTNILDNLLLLVENKLQLNFQEIGFQLVIAANGCGIQYMQGILYSIYST